MNQVEIWNPKTAARLLLVALVSGLGAAGLAMNGGKDEEAAVLAGTGLRPLEAENDAPELALLMGDLQRLTHKMALSANEGNAELAGFYMHESMEQLRTIQRDSPEYEGQPVALLIERLGLPAYEKLKEALAAKPSDRGQMLSALEVVIQSCNNCHTATHHGIIRITPGTEVNPFNQSFKP